VIITGFVFQNSDLWISIATGHTAAILDTSTMAALVLVAAALVAPCGADPTLLFGHARQNSSIGATAAAFGDSFPHLVQGVLFTYQGNGCGSLSNEERRPSAGQAWIAVVARGDCTFVEKAMLAQV
jgi:hypothetical protein